jgi:hypothetical protein
VAPRRPLILASLLLAAFAINLGTTIVNVALPRWCEASTHQPSAAVIVGAYNLVFGALVLAAAVHVGWRAPSYGAAVSCSAWARL